MLLAVDTSTRTVGLALYDGVQVLYELAWTSHDFHTVELAPAVASLLERSDQDVSVSAGNSRGNRPGLLHRPQDWPGPGQGVSPGAPHSFDWHSNPRRSGGCPTADGLAHGRRAARRAWPAGGRLVYCRQWRLAKPRLRSKF